MKKPPTELRHHAFDSDSFSTGRPISQARLTDQQKLAVVLQGAAILHHLETCRLRLADGWIGARIDSDGRLLLPPPVDDAAEKLPQLALRNLLHLAFRQDEEIQGRGSARRIARILDGRWRQPFMRWPARRMTAELLQAAPFLWQPAFLVARQALVAERRTENDVSLLFAAPSGPRRRFLAQAKSRIDLETRLADEDAEILWDGVDENADPLLYCARSEWRKAADCWKRRPPQDNDEILAYGECLFTLGRYSEALAQTARLRRNAAWILQLRCHAGLGETNTAIKTLRSLGDRKLNVGETLTVAQIAVKLLGRKRRYDEVRDWSARAFQAGKRGKRRRQAALIAAEAAWETGRIDQIDRHLETARGAEKDVSLKILHHKVGILRAYSARDGRRIIEHGKAILSSSRKNLEPAVAGNTWSEIALGRVLSGDLKGAEKASRHALRILAGQEGNRPVTLAISNLAEVRLRRGLLAGVEDAIRQSLEEDRRTENASAIRHDFELWMRYELARGDAQSALLRHREALEELDLADGDRQRSVLDLLAARAYGRLGRAEEAAAILERLPEDELLQLEPEERPALWGLAGRPDAAARRAAGTPWSGFWSSHLSDLDPDESHWREVERLEPYRAARLTLDCESVRPGCAPRHLVRRAVDALTSAGAQRMARRLEDRSAGPWSAVERYLRKVSPDSKEIAKLLTAAGYPEVRLTWREEDRTLLLADGVGGDHRTEFSGDEGKLVLQSPRSPDAPLTALLALIARDYRPPTVADSPQDAGAAKIIGRSPALRDAIERLDRLSRGDHPILILGESGTGKELAAQRIHEQSLRSSAPFLPVNCAALQENLIQSELFGHAQSAFTGADRPRMGVFEAAQGGTVFLDEIGDLPAEAQGKLLRVLQEREIRRVGDNTPRKIDARVVAATHRDLSAMVREGSFRQDLYYRLNMAVVVLPPLRERGEDILLLTDAILKKYELRSGPVRIVSEARDLLLQHPWPGNVRQLKNVLEIAATLTQDGRIKREDLELPEQQTSERTGDYHQAVLNFRKELIREALIKSEGRQSEAARRLGLTRQALSYLVRQLELNAFVQKKP